MRMVLVGMRTRLKNRIHSTLAKYAIKIEEVEDIFGVEGKKILRGRVKELPPQTRKSIEAELELLDRVEEQIRWNEKEIEAVIPKTAQMKLLMTVPGIGSILAVVIALEVGDVERFGRPAKNRANMGRGVNFRCPQRVIFHCPLTIRRTRGSTLAVMISLWPSILKPQTIRYSEA